MKYFKSNWAGEALLQSGIEREDKRKPKDTRLASQPGQSLKNWAKINIKSSSNIAGKKLRDRASKAGPLSLGDTTSKLSKKEFNVDSWKKRRQTFWPSPPSDKSALEAETAERWKFSPPERKFRWIIFGFFSENFKRIKKTLDDCFRDWQDEAFLATWLRCLKSSVPARANYFFPTFLNRLQSMRRFRLP